MPSRFFTSGRKVLDHHVGLLDQRAGTRRALPCDFRLSVMAALVAVQVLEVRTVARAARRLARVSAGGCSILMTLAPQSASWRTQVGPDRTWVRSSTVKRSSAREALGNAIPVAPSEAIVQGPAGTPGRRHSPILRALSTEETRHRVFLRFQGRSTTVRAARPALLTPMEEPKDR